MARPSQALAVRAMVDESRASPLDSPPTANKAAVRARIEAAGFGMAVVLLQV